MLNILPARPSRDPTEQQQVRTLAPRIHAPADWAPHTTIVAHKWDGRRTHQNDVCE